MHNQHTGGMARSLVERGGKKGFVEDLAHLTRKNVRKPRYSKI